MSAIERALDAYDLWWPTATQAFDLLLNEDHRAYGVSCIYDNGMTDRIPDDPRGWLDDGETPLDLTAYSAHTRIAFQAISEVFDSDLRDWMEPIRTLSHRWGVRLYLGFRFWREDGRIKTHFQIIVEPGEKSVESTTLTGLLNELGRTVDAAYA